MTARSKITTVVPRRRFFALAGLLLCFVMLCGFFGPLADGVSACPTCKDSIAHSDPESANLVRGYFWSILFMMSMPFLILGGLASYFYYEVRKARRLRGSSVPAADLHQPT